MCREERVGFEYKTGDGRHSIGDDKIKSAGVIYARLLLVGESWQYDIYFKGVYSSDISISKANLT